MKAATQPSSVTGDLPVRSAKGSLEVSILDDCRSKQHFSKNKFCSLLPIK